MQIYLLRINEEQNHGQDDHSLLKNGRQDEALGTWVKTSPFGQQVLSKIQRMHSKEWDDSQASPLELPPLQHCQTDYQDVQKPFVSILSRVDNRFRSPCGAISRNQRNSLSTYYNRAMLHQKCLHMPMSMGNTTT
jgi:hypothetical protein